jgi:hypothetical protein
VVGGTPWPFDPARWPDAEPELPGLDELAGSGCEPAVAGGPPGAEPDCPGDDDGGPLLCADPEFPGDDGGPLPCAESEFPGEDEG